MSNIYIKEPSTDGKVLLQTTVGDIDIELWSKEAPLACRNFVQLCMEGYYNGVIFHRIIPGSIIQGGDPTGTGMGGESIYGKPFKDEFHQRLRFVRRGLVAMANAGPNDNTSQFFFTFGPCNDLNKKHTIFGKVTGDTVYNMIRLGDCGVDTDERPINPPSIKKTKVIANPFDDIVPRFEPDKKKRAEEKKKKSQSRATKDYKLLSFGEEAEADEEESMDIQFKGPKSSHDLANDPRLSSKTVDDIATINEEDGSDRDSEDVIQNKSSTDEESNSNRTERIRDKLTLSKDGNQRSTEGLKSADGVTDKIKQLRKESRQIARELSNKKKEVEEKDDSDSDSDGEELRKTNPIYADYKAQQEEFRAKTAVAKKKGTGREEETMKLLNNFKSKMLTVREEANWNDSDDDEKPTITTKDESSDEDDKVGWLMHKFKNDDSLLRDAKDMNRDENEDRYDITDPRNTLNKRRRNEKEDRGDKRRKHDYRHSRSDGHSRSDSHSTSHRSDRDRHRHHRR